MTRAARWGLACIVVVAAMLADRPARAQAPDEGLYDHFRLGWYHSLSGIQRLKEIAATRAPLVMPYDGGKLVPFLDRAREQNIDVLPEIPRALISDQNYEGIAAYVAEHDGHPAVIGWYAADEPGLKTKVDWSPPVMTSVYEAIRSRSDKPVYLCFSYVEMDRGDVQRYRNAFDVMLVNHYPYVLSKLGETKATTDLAYWQNLIVRTADVARELDRPWLNILQAIGPRKGKEYQVWRLPTLDESRFQLYWSVLHNAQGALFFTYYWTRDVLASPGEAFEGTGRVWVESVFKPLANEFKPVEAALLPRNAVQHGVDSSNGDVLARVYRDPNDESLVLVAVNGSSASQQAHLRVTVNGEWQAESLVGRINAREGTSLDLQFAPHEAIVCRLVSR